MKLVVGLGNPGRKYEETRHNIGFEVAVELARRFGQSTPRSKFQGEVVEGTIGGEKLLVLCPHTYMNKSGSSVLASRDFYKLELTDLLVVCDDLSLPLGKLRIRTKGSSGGQNGLRDIIGRIGSEEFPRLRIGIGTPPPGWDAADFVLSKFTKDDLAEMKIAVSRAADAVECWVRDGIECCMNRYNAG
ncbi:MAG: aminoacyl-tRNA hydrolase [Planctomycetaceae bacterium]|nr:aminoacyl-tRNA hydrolase [Planctomycetales bacterium]MCB9872767.1 aminoacyl-tRNA hydrolase [Planctomycetaceae bacterium]MCB9926253.1 aminoacyl-tRNA hydrolase [Planctomycetaceae bacterium]